MPVISAIQWTPGAEHWVSKYRPTGTVSPMLGLLLYVL